VIVGLRRAVASFFANQGFFLAAGLSFYFLICIIPLLFLVVSATGLLLSHETAAAAAVGKLTQTFPVYRKEIARALLRVIQTRTVSGVVGTTALIMFSTQLFSATRLVLNRLFGFRPTQGALRSIAFDTVLVFAIAPLFAGSVVTSDLFALVVSYLVERGEVSGDWIGYSSVGFSVLSSATMFYLIYRFLPDRRVGKGPALAGALLTSVLWEVAKQLFRLYIRRLGVYDLIYGPLGALVGFVMFVYYTMIVFVLGAAYAAALEPRRR
jgi:membrane protein